MTEIAIMVEGQNGLNWERWQRLALAVEELGFVGLYRSDHFTNPQPPDLNSLECMISLAWLASHTSRIEFGQLVSPVSFRDPVMLARQALAIDDLSGGRLSLGIGAGWQEREHHSFGYELLELRPRLARFEEGVEVITRLLWSDEPVSYDGTYYQLHDAVLLPRPQRPRGPRIVIGGNGPQRTLPLAARYADEWNGVMAPPAMIRERNQLLNELLGQQGRQPGDVRRSFMTNIVFGRDDAEVARKLDGRDGAAMRERGFIVGTASAAVEQIGAFAEAGAERVMLQWLDLDDLDGLAALAAAVLGKV